jgi:pyruvate/2-oxoglutarate dehydrogenase complex dihydrolipoamide dehydrogenase (E3) component
VDVRLRTPASLAALRALRPDVVLVATGSRAARPPLPGTELPHVATAHEVLSGERAVSAGPAIVLGGGATGLETA